MTGTVGIVAIGRNEGTRLVACLESPAFRQATASIYVDSGSSDDSVDTARSMGVLVRPLDPAAPFSAARARNEGFEQLTTAHPDIAAVQFVDGDTVLADAWIGHALRALVADDQLAIVCGRLRESRPSASIYNALCDIEWDGPVGDIEECGGIFLVRASAFAETGGFDTAQIAGEEPELCARLRAAGWRIARIDAEMGTHDAAIDSFGQWWRRSIRAGWADAALAHRVGSSGASRAVRATLSNLVWGAGGFTIAAAALVAGGTFARLSVIAVFALQAWRIARGCRARGRGAAESRAYGAFTMLGKLPQAWGAIRYGAGLFLGRRTEIIEYKRAPGD